MRVTVMQSPNTNKGTSKRTKVIALDKVRFHGEIMTPGKQYEMTPQELLVYAKHIKAVNLPSGVKKTTSSSRDLPKAKETKKKSSRKKK